MSRATPCIVWFRQDLRLADSPALAAAAATGSPVIPLYIHAPEAEGNWPPGAASRWWLHGSLAELDRSLRRCGSRLILRRGPPASVLVELHKGTGARRVYWNRRHESAPRAEEQSVASQLKSQNIEVENFNAALLHDPHSVCKADGSPYQIFTAFWNALRSRDEPSAPIAPPQHLPAPTIWPDSLTLDALHLEPTIDWAGGLRDRWTPGEANAQSLLDKFLAEPIIEYPVERDRPDRRGVSSLSPHLHFGEIGPRQIWHAVHERAALDPRRGYQNGAAAWLRQLAWREFAYHLLHFFPHTPEKPLRPRFEGFPWLENPAALIAWQQGKTGYPIVDAGMRELWRTGWMHNRVRMIVASFLVKHLLLPWPAGAAWFWDTLVDADLANNTLGWQWSAGCGADAAPYFRVFNPVSQGGKFDPVGNYVRQWVPELTRIPAKFIHSPWLAPASVLSDAEVKLGSDYPEPIVDHAWARNRALAAFEALKQSK